MASSFFKNAVVLGLITATGPFAIDMYLPALPSIAADLHTTNAATQMSLAAFMGAIAICQLFYGPISDMVGRKLPLYFGLGLFAFAGIGCFFAPSMEWLIFFRFIQGIGACAGMIVPRAVVRDLHTGVEAARLMSTIMLVFSVSPILAPLAGSFVIAAFGWRSVFVFISVAALAGIALVAFALEETRPREQRIRAGLGAVIAGYRLLLSDRNFVGLSLIGGLGMASFFAFLANSSFVYIGHFGLTPMQYSVAFSVNAVGFFAAAQMSSLLAGRFGFGPVVRAAVASYSLIAVLLFLLTLAGLDSLPPLIALLFMAFAALGLVIPSTAVLALDNYGPLAGTASALMGTLQLICGVAVMGLTSLFFDGSPLPMVSAVAACSVLALLIGRFTLAARRPARAAAE